MRRDMCSMCGGPFDGPAHLVNATRREGRRHWSTRDLICGPCHQRGQIGRGGSTTALDSERTNGRFQWHPWPTGRGELLPPTPCEACGLVVVRHGDPLLKRVTCSAACLTSLSDSRNAARGNKGSAQPCETCGEDITTGRADSRYCSPKCRQKAYRQRQATQPPAPLTDKRGRRLPQRSPAESLRKSVPVLSGLAEAMGRVDRIDDAVTPEDAAQWSGELDESIGILQDLHSTLEARGHQSSTDSRND